jgi:hypothetical protein
MATCYRCGASNANYRRNTFTGSSTSSWSSRRSFGSGSRTYYGVRSVCSNCAKSIDTWNRVKLIFWLVVICILILAFLNRLRTSSKSSTQSDASSLYYSRKRGRIISANGLNLRVTPNSDGAVLATVPYNETVGILDKNGMSETISGQTANWYKVEYNGTTGWIWSGYLLAD